MGRPLGRILALTLTIVLTAGCTEVPVGDAKPGGTGEQSPSRQSADNELLIYTVWPAYYVKEEIFQKQIGDYIRKKFPDITVKHIAWDNPGRQYKDLIAAGTIPDIIMDDTRMNVQRYIIDNDLHYDMTELIKKYNFDTSKFNPAHMAQMRNLTPDGKLYGLPFYNNDYVLFYNKDIFDKFGVDYPRDGMTYDEIYELAKRLTRVEGEITYKGFSQHPGHYLNFNQLSLSPLSRTEDKADLSAPGWKLLVDNMRRFYEIPANQFDTVETFASKPSLAMAVASVSDHVVKFHEANKSLNYDFVSVPSFPDAPGIKYQPNVYSMYITKQSTKKDLAFQVIAALLSEEHQIELAKEGVIGPLETEAIKSAFGQNLPQLQGKNIQSVFYGNNAMPPPARQEGLVWYDAILQNIFQPLIFSESKDSVTALRMTEEKTTKEIEQKKADKALSD
ncbi:ABC transporter substrate-binding protein [Paenibacillus chartarius]|uniref:ABC transporter substrate-binding protein n=1 Tax=Paenibacillus chartarius TaxID=747481 RepID=A0ABV6DDY7_9BACL